MQGSKRVPQRSKANVLLHRCKWLFVGIAVFCYFFYVNETLSVALRDPTGPNVVLVSPDIPDDAVVALHAANYASANRDSYGLLPDISQSSWQMLQDRVRRRQNHAFPLDPNKHANKISEWWGYNFDPEFTCMHEERVGGLGDGPKWVCNPAQLKHIAGRRMEQEGHGCLIYSIGSYGDFTFEVAMLEQLGDAPCEVHIFDLDDYSKEIPKKYEDRIHFHEWGFKQDGTPDPGPRKMGRMAKNGQKPANEVVFHSLQESLRLLGHEGRVIDVFKIDCEGCELTTFRDWMSADADIRQIMVEIHAGKPKPLPIQLFESLQNNNYVAFHKEANTLAGSTCFEYSFLKLHPDFFMTPSSLRQTVQTNATKE